MKNKSKIASMAILIGLGIFVGSIALFAVTNIIPIMLLSYIGAFSTIGGLSYKIYQYEQKHNNIFKTDKMQDSDFLSEKEDEKDKLKNFENIINLQKTHLDNNQEIEKE